MLRQVSIHLTAILIAGIVLSAAPKKEYFTDGELDLIRDAQELSARVSTYFDLAERRLIILGVAERSERQKEKERKDQEKFEKEKKKAGDKASTVKAPEDQLAYLHDFARSELVRGYMQALDEVMSNIDDYYSRKLDVRGSLEDLEKFSRETLPLLQKIEPKTAIERTAIEEAIDKAKEANAGAKGALQKVPKTEKKPKPSV